LKKFWNFKAANGRAELLLYGDISGETWFGDEVTPKQFKADLDVLGDVGEIDIHINSGGGDVFAGFAIYNMLKRHAAQKTVYVDGLAASIASVIAMAGDKIIMPENAAIMIHNGWTIMGGNKGDLRRVADELERIDGQIAQIYADRTGVKNAAELMDAETWMFGADAVEMGFADEVEENHKIAASIDGAFLNVNGQKFDLARFKDAQKLRDRVPAPEQPPQGGFFIPDNGGESQPVTDTSALMEQRKRFDRLRKKMLEGN